jgi:hypothetical protein
LEWIKFVYSIEERFIAMTISLQPKFGAWAQGNSQPLKQLVNEIEETLELPIIIPPAQPPAPVAVQINWPPEQQAKITELQETLKNVTKTDGYGMKDAVKTLQVLKETGYQLTKEETEKFKILVQKSDYNLHNAIQYFPKSGYFDYESSRFTMDELNMFIPVWLKEQNDYRSVVTLLNSIDRSEKFVASNELTAVIGERLQKLNADLQKPEIRQAYLKGIGDAFRPKAAVAKDIQTVVEYLFPPMDLFQSETANDVKQAIDLIAQRNRKIEYAGRTTTGELYLITESTDSQNYKTSVYYGQPGQLAELTYTGGSRAKDGSDTFIETKEGINFRFLRGGLFNHDDKTRWKGFVNNIEVAQEYPTDELENRK